MTDEIFVNEVAKAGKRGVKNVTHLPSLFAHLFEAVESPMPPQQWSVLGGLTNQWGVLGNDKFGDCVEVATENDRHAKAVITPPAHPGGIPVYEQGFILPTTAITEELYFDYGVQIEGGAPPCPDNGSDPGTWLPYLFQLSQLNAAQQRAQDVAEDDIDEIAFAEIDLSDPTQIISKLRSAIVNFRGVIITAHLTENAEQLFEERKEWIMEGTRVDLYEGHGIYVGAYDQSSFTSVTWGLLQKMSLNWLTSCITSAWVIVTKEDAQRTGFNFTGCINSIKQLQGAQVAPSAIPPTPTPTPTTTPNIDPVHPVSPLIESVPETFMQKVEAEVEHARELTDEEWKRVEKDLHKVLGLALQREAVSVLQALLNTIIQSLTQDKKL